MSPCPSTNTDHFNPEQRNENHSLPPIHTQPVQNTGVPGLPTSLEACRHRCHRCSRHCPFHRPPYCRLRYHRGSHYCRCCRRRNPGGRIQCGHPGRHLGLSRRGRCQRRVVVANGNVWAVGGQQKQVEEGQADGEPRLPPRHLAVERHVVVVPGDGAILDGLEFIRRLAVGVSGRRGRGSGGCG